MAEFSYRKEILQFAAEQYGTEPAYLWAKYPRYAALRHNDKKWYALIMDVPKEKLRLPGTGIVDIINLKVEPLLAGSLRMEKGIFPGIPHEPGELDQRASGWNGRPRPNQGSARPQL